MTSAKPRILILCVTFSIAYLCSVGGFTACSSKKNSKVTGPEPNPLDTLSAEFSATPTTGPDPLTVQFQDESEYFGDAWLWSFGDDSTSTERNPLHVYSVSGEYDVRLIVQSAAKTDTVVKTAFVKVRPHICPTADIAWSLGGPIRCEPYKRWVCLRDVSTGDITQRLWSGNNMPGCIVADVGSTVAMHLTVIYLDKCSHTTYEQFVVPAYSQPPPCP